MSENDESGHSLMTNWLRDLPSDPSRFLMVWAIQIALKTASEPEPS